MTGWAWIITAAALHLGASGGLILGVLWAEARTTRKETTDDRAE